MGSREEYPELCFPPFLSNQYFGHYLPHLRIGRAVAPRSWEQHYTRYDQDEYPPLQAIGLATDKPIRQESEQVVTHQPATSFSISLPHSFNRAGGRTSNVGQENETLKLSIHVSSIGDAVDRLCDVAYYATRAGEAW